MLRVLLIDSNEERNTSLTRKLKDQCDIVSINMINSDNLVTPLMGMQVVILLDQDPLATVTLIEQALLNKSFVVITNLIKPKGEPLNENIIYFNQSTDLEAGIVTRIQILAKVLDNPYMQPIAEDPHSQALLSIARKAAKTQATVLVSGETGVGKEVLAHYIHYHSACAKGPFITVNCAALPENMIEAILFGYEKGAFTSAINSYVGKFEQAQNGTLLLDEISEISIGLQAKLLRVLQEHELERLGGKKIIKSNARIIAATNRDLNQQVANGLFRKDLYYRLNVINLHCAALRERPLDILPLAQFFLKHHAHLLGRGIPTLSEFAKIKLTHYQWPGNIREMDNVIQRALILTEGECLDADDIELNETILAMNAKHELIELEQFSSKLEENAAKIIMDVLKETDGCRNVAAKKLNMSPRTLRYKIAKLRAIGVKVP